MFSSRIDFDGAFPPGATMAHQLNGDVSPLGDLRGYRISSNLPLSEEQARRIRTILTTPESFGGDGARCFAPGLGFSMGSDAERLEILVCLSCYWALFFRGDTEMTEALSEAGHHQLKEFYAELFPNSNPNVA